MSATVQREPAAHRNVPLPSPFSRLLEHLDVYIPPGPLPQILEEGRYGGEGLVEIAIQHRVGAHFPRVPSSFSIFSSTRFSASVASGRRAAGRARLHRRGVRPLPAPSRLGHPPRDW